MTTVLEHRTKAPGRRIRLARTADAASLHHVLTAAFAAGANLELVFPDGTRTRVARPVDAATLRGLIETTTAEGHEARLELVYDRRGS